jgi:hypothetical protein
MPQTYGVFLGEIKMATSWTKNQLVICFSDFDNTWSVKTIPLTFNQAMKFVLYVTRGNLFHKDYKIVSLTEWDAMQKKSTQETA